MATSGQWASANGAFSYCNQTAATTVSCFHHATAGDGQALTSNCKTEGVSVGPIAVVGSCQVTLEGISSGAGKEVSDGFAPGCETLSFGSATLTFTDTTGVAYPPVNVTIVNFSGVASFSGTAVNSAGVAVAHAEGSFTLACGSPSEAARGTFKGTYETLV